MNSKEIAFIICVNNEVLFEECKYYIDHLNVPNGYIVDVIAIREADSMCAAYNAGMQNSDAKFKVYMHQDVFIRNTDFLINIIELFEQDETVGMIGMVGGNRMPKTGVTYRAWDTGTVDCRDPDLAYYMVFEPEVKQDAFVEAVDGLLIATQYDVPWREDLFQHFDFYDVSQSFEMRKAGHKILVPYQKIPWVIHDSSFAKLNHYDEARQIALKEYPEYLYAENGYDFVYNKEWNELSDMLALQMKQMMEQGEWNQVAAIIASYRSGQMKSSALEMLGLMSDIHEAEIANKAKTRFFEGFGSWNAIYEKYMWLRFSLRRMELGMPETEYMELVTSIKDRKVSYDAVLTMILHSIADKKVCLEKCIAYYKQSGQSTYANQLEKIYAQVKLKGLPYAYTKVKK